MVPADPNDGRNVIITIRGTEGGEEANLFAKDLYEMYLRYADQSVAGRRRGPGSACRASDLGGIAEADVPQ